MAPKDDTQSCIFVIENMALSVSYWANYCENKPKLVWRSENGVESNHVLYFNCDNRVRSCGIIHSHDHVEHQLSCLTVLVSHLLHTPN